MGRKLTLLTTVAVLLLPLLTESPAGAAAAPGYTLSIPRVAWLQARGAAVATTVQFTCPRKAGSVSLGVAVAQASGGDVHTAVNNVLVSCTGSVRPKTLLETFNAPISVPFSPGTAQLSVELSIGNTGRTLHANRIVTLSEHPLRSSIISSLTRVAGGAAFVVTATVPCSAAGTLDVIGTASQRVTPSLVQPGILRQDIICAPPQTVATLYVPAPRRPWTKDAAVVEISALCADTCRYIEAIHTFGQPQ